MTNTDLEAFMVKLRCLLYEDEDEDDNNTPILNIESRKPEIQLLYEELGCLLGSSFKVTMTEEEELEDVGNWIKRRLIEAAQEFAEDFVDMFISSAIFKKKFIRDGNRRWLAFILENDLFYCSLKSIMGDLKSIREEMSHTNGNFFRNVVEPQMMGNNFEASGTCSSGNTRADLSPTEHEEFIVGFDDDALLIIDRLTAHRKKLDFISIVGMGGLGKTTLATKIFNDSLVEYHFDIRGWVTVSQAYSKRGLLVQLLTSIGKSVHEAATEPKLCEVLYQSLKGRRYLMAIDDIWSCKAWDDVRLCFPDDKTGSRVLVTTRLTEVALHANQGGFTHNLGHLNEDQSWELLCRKTFRGYECPETLIEAGKRIAKRCGGLPLSLIVIAGLLEKGEKRKDLWEKIARSVGSHVINDPKGCLDTLALSYDNLPYHLKKCFLYVGGFPEDYKIQVRTLIKLWMAEGFVKESEQRSLEEEGAYHLMDLIDRNLLVVADKSSNGGVKSCRLHDLLRELCLKKADEENFLKKVSMPTFGRNLDSSFVYSLVKQRRLFTDYRVLNEIYSHAFATRMRSVLCFFDIPSEDRTTSWVCSFSLLRVLDLLNIQNLMFDFDNIGMLVHLRYLAVWPHKESSFSNIWSLQTFIVKGKLCPIYSFDNMVNLRHLR